MAVAALVDAPAQALLSALDAVRDEPAPLGQVPARLSVLAHAAAELQGVYLRELALAEQAGEALAVGCRGTADLLVEHAGLTAAQARSDAALARRLAVLPGLLDAVAGGGLELPAARHLARAWAVLPDRLRDAATARALLTLGGLADLADLKAKVDELVSAVQPEVTDDALAAAHQAGELVLVDVGAETRLSGHTDAVTGEWLREVLQGKAEADRGLADTRTSGGRLLDALLDLVRGGQEGEHPHGDGSVPTLVVVTTPEDLLATQDAGPDAPRAEDALDDLLGGLRAGPGEHAPGPARGSRTRGGVRLGPRTLARLACEAALTRLLVDDRGWPLDSSPRARQLTRRERRALEQRAGYRCQRAGCGRGAWACVPHHVVPWALGGPSTQANTVLLCRSCHHLLHDQQRALELTDGSRIGPRGWARPPPGAPPPQLW